MALTQEALLSFLLERGGRVKNSELLHNFRSQISCSDPAEKQHNRDLFKKLVNSVAVVKQVDGVKFVVVKKRYQDFVREVEHDAAAHTQPTDEDSFSSRNTSFSYASPPRRAPSAGTIYADIENNNVRFPSDAHERRYGDARGSVRDVGGADTTTVKVLNISADQPSRAGKSGAVFAVIAVKSPPRAPGTQAGLHSQVHHSEPADRPVTSVSATSVPNLNFPACRKVALSGPQCGKNRQAEEPPQVRPPSKTTRQGDDAKYSESVPLEPAAHEWLVKCAAGLWGQIYGLLLQDTRLAHKKDFMSGFTALHWAAKDGNSEMIHKLMDVSRKRGTCVNVNSKAHGGYTPLHIAAIHGHTEVMVLLVQKYGANVNERDNDGKKASHYLGKGVPGEVRGLLGGPQLSKAEDEEYREQSRGFSTISKLFQPHIGKKQKTAKFAHDW